MEKDYFSKMKEIADECIIDIINQFRNNNINKIFIQDEFYILTQGKGNPMKLHKLVEITLGVNLNFITENNEMFAPDDLVLSVIPELHPIVTQEITRMSNAIKENEKQYSCIDATKRIFFVPNEYKPEKLEDFDFCGKAFKYGKVLTIEDFVKEFNTNSINLFNGVIRYLDCTDNFVEVCPHCGYEVVLETKFEEQICPICNKHIAPCSLCDTCTDDCPFRNL